MGSKADLAAAATCEDNQAVDVAMVEFEASSAFAFQGGLEMMGRVIEARRRGSRTFSTRTTGLDFPVMAHIDRIRVTKSV
jgi:hypothetical protein